MSLKGKCVLGEILSKKTESWKKYKKVPEFCFPISVQALHRSTEKIIKFFVFRTTGPRCLKLEMLHGLVVATKFIKIVALSIKWPHTKGSWVRTIEKHRKIFKNLLLPNHLAQVLEIWYVAWPSGHLPTLFKWWSQGLKWPHNREVWV